MHELSIAQNIVEIAEKYADKNNSAKIIEIEIEVGQLSGVVIEALEFAMKSATLNTKLEGSEIKLIDIEGVAKCNNCNNEYSIEQLYEICPNCQSYHSEIIKGKELRVKSLLVD